MFNGRIHYFSPFSIYSYVKLPEGKYDPSYRSVQFVWWNHPVFFWDEVELSSHVGQALLWHGWGDSHWFQSEWTWTYFVASYENSQMYIHIVCPFSIKHTRTYIYIYMYYRYDHTPYTPQDLARRLHPHRSSLRCLAVVTRTSKACYSGGRVSTWRSASPWPWDATRSYRRVRSPGSVPRGVWEGVGW